MDRDTQKLNQYPWESYPYSDGELIDAGGWKSHPNLLQSQINPVNSIAILNVGNTKSWSRKITNFDEETGKMFFEPISTDNGQWAWKNENHYYFLEGKFELIDQPGEWYFDSDLKVIYYMVESGQNPNNMNIRVKTQAYGMTCENSRWNTFTGLEFFANTFQFLNCDDTVVSNFTLVYRSIKKERFLKFYSYF